jgi:hypothetical protein
MTMRGRAGLRRTVREVCLSLLALLTLTAAVMAQTPSPAPVLRRPASVAVLRTAEITPEGGLTLEHLRSDPNLTPERFGQYFRDFAFKLGQDRQAPKDFLAARSGDCDDFACLAAEVLGEKKYTTKLVAVFMQGQTHVVCYVEEVHGYLDYNLRKEASAVQAAGDSLEEIADKVAAYFRNPWGSASEFQYDGTRPRFGRIVFASVRTTGPAEQHARLSDHRPPSIPPPVQTVASAALEAH